MDGGETAPPTRTAFRGSASPLGGGKKGRRRPASDSSHFVLDGELVIPVWESLELEALQMRLQPAESRVSIFHGVGGVVIRHLGESWLGRDQSRAASITGHWGHSR